MITMRGPRRISAARIYRERLAGGEAREHCLHGGMTILTAQQGILAAQAGRADQQTKEHIHIHLTIHGAGKARRAFRKWRITPLFTEPVEVSGLLSPVSRGVEQAVYLRQGL